VRRATRWTLGIVTSGAVAHLDKALLRLVRHDPFVRKISYATDTHSFENWLRTEIAYEVSKDRYEKVGHYWGHPEAVGLTDIAIFKGRTKAASLLVELKVLWNKQGLGNGNVSAVRRDWRKLKKKVAQKESSAAALLVAFVFMVYREHSYWPHLRRLKSIDDFQSEVFGNLTFVKKLASFDVPVITSKYRPHFAVRICRIGL
jgi:hypothetical protein